MVTDVDVVCSIISHESWIRSTDTTTLKMPSAQSTTKTSGDLTTSNSVSGFAKFARELEHSVKSGVIPHELKKQYGSQNIAKLLKVIPKGRKLYDEMIKQPHHSVESKWHAGMSPEDSGYKEIIYRAQGDENHFELDEILELMGFQTGFTLRSPKNTAQLAESEELLPPGPNKLIGHELDLTEKQVQAIWHQVVNEVEGLLIAFGN